MKTDDNGDTVPLEKWKKAELIAELQILLRRRFVFKIQGLTMLDLTNENITLLLLYRTGTRNACVDLFDAKLRDIRMEVCEGAPPAASHNRGTVK